MLAGLSSLSLAVSSLIGGQTDALIAFVFASGMNLGAYWKPDRLVLSMHRAHEVDAAHAADLHGLVAKLALRAGLPMPRVYIMTTRSRTPSPLPAIRGMPQLPLPSASYTRSTVTRWPVCSRTNSSISAHRDALIITAMATIAVAIFHIFHARQFRPVLRFRFWS